MRWAERGATLLEAAIVVPLLLVLIFGLVEFGRYVSVTSTVTNASREAARYAAGTGTGSGSAPRYVDCDGIRGAAQQFAILGEPMDGDITLEYDHGPSSGSPFEDCAPTEMEEDPAKISTGDRIIATVDVPFEPIVHLVGNFLGPTNISVQTIRTINKG